MMPRQTFSILSPILRSRKESLSVVDEMDIEEVTEVTAVASTIVEEEVVVEATITGINRTERKEMVATEAVEVEDVTLTTRVTEITSSETSLESQSTATRSRTLMPTCMTTLTRMELKAPQPRRVSSTT